MPAAKTSLLPTKQLIVKQKQTGLYCPVVIFTRPAPKTASSRNKKGRKILQSSGPVKQDVAALVLGFDNRTFKRILHEFKRIAEIVARRVDDNGNLNIIWAEHQPGGCAAPLAVAESAAVCPVGRVP